jgi:hypothetical protein
MMTTAILYYTLIFYSPGGFAVLPMQFRTELACSVTGNGWRERGPREVSFICLPVHVEPGK